MSSPSAPTVVPTVAVTASVASAEENGVEAISILGVGTTTTYNHAPTLLPVALSPAPLVGSTVGANRKLAKVTVYCPTDGEIAPTASASASTSSAVEVKVAPDDD